jgi:hypothetical protein
MTLAPLVEEGALAPVTTSLVEEGALAPVTRPGETHAYLLRGFVTGLTALLNQRACGLTALLNQRMG